MNEKNTIEVDVDEWISDDDKRHIAKEAFKSACFKRSHEDFERILSNAAYSMVQTEVDAVFDGDMAAVVKQKATEVINNLSSYSVFKPKNVFDESESKGWSILQAEVAASQPMIAARVHEIIASLDQDELRETIGERIASAIISKLGAA